MEFLDNIYIPSELCHIIFSHNELYYQIGLLRLVCKSFAQLIKPTRRLPNKKSKLRYSLLMNFTETIKDDRLQDFINIIQKRWANCHIVNETNIIKIFELWLIKQKFLRDIILTPTDKEFGRFTNSYHPYHTGKTGYTYLSEFKDNKSRRFSEYKCYITIPIKRLNSTLSWYIQFTNYGFKLNHDMFGYNACTDFTIQFIKGNVKINYVIIFSRHKSRCICYGR